MIYLPGCLPVPDPRPLTPPLTKLSKRTFSLLSKVEVNAYLCITVAITQEFNDSKWA